MKRIFSIGALALLFCFSIAPISEANAQIFTTACATYTPVDRACVGQCGNPGVIEYEFGPLCSSLAGNFCVSNEWSNLCPSHDAIAYVFDDGVLVATGNITTVGSSVGFTALCPSKIKVVVVAVPNGSGINCIQFGEMYFYLRMQ